MDPSTCRAREVSVPSGAYVVSREKNETLAAYLGTCVGVALCDRRAKVGGLIHLLLPEPTGIDKPWQPECYASTGVPLFLKALSDLGANTADMEASVAGGALVGKVCQRDLNLDIGGRTADIVEALLHRNGIRIAKSETGGHFTCNLKLNLKTWDSEIQAIGDKPVPPGTFKKPTAHEIDKTIQKVRPIPQIALKIIRMIQEQEFSIQEVGEAIRQDQIISASVIKHCNSSFLGLKNKIDSVDRALVVLGEKRLLQLVVSASVESFFPESECGYSLCKGGLHQHAMGVALIAEKLAQFTGRAAPDLAYTAGLLHDIGKVVLDQYMAPAYPLFYRGTQVDGFNLIHMENELIGMSHPTAGYRLATYWDLPENLTEAVRHHHEPEQATSAPGLTHLVYLADLLMSRLVVGHELDHLDTDRLPQRMNTVGLREQHLPVLVDLIPPGVLRANTAP